MIDAFGVEISKSGVGAGRYVRAIDMPAKIRARQIARLKEGKPQVASIQDQIFRHTRDNPKKIDFDSLIPKTKGTVIPTGRRKRKAELHNIDGKNIGLFNAATVPNARKNTNHILVQDKTKTKGVPGFLLEHEKAHAKLRSRRLAQSPFRTANQRLGEEARADAIAAIKTGRKRIPSAYPLAGNKNYERVYTKITGRKPEFKMTMRDTKETYPLPEGSGNKIQIRRTYKGFRSAVNSQQNKAANGEMLREAFTRRSPGPEYQSTRKPNLP